MFVKNTQAFMMERKGKEKTCGNGELFSRRLKMLFMFHTAKQDLRSSVTGGKNNYLGKLCLKPAGQPAARIIKGRERKGEL